MAVAAPLTDEIKVKVQPWMFADPATRQQFVELASGLSLGEKVQERGLLTEGDIGKFVDIATRRRMKRALTRAASKMMNMGTGMEETVGIVVKEIYEASYEDLKIWEGREQMLLGMHHAFDRRKNRGQLMGLSFGPGFPQVNDICQGLRPNAFFVLAASQGSGKSALALEWALSMAYDQKIPVLWISLEMSELDISTRILAKRTKLSAKGIMTGNLEDTEFGKLGTVHLMHGGPLYMVSSSQMTISQIVALTRKMKETKGIQAVFVDYVQLISGTSGMGDNSYERMGAVSGELKNRIALSRNIGIPVMAIAQLNRQAASAKVSISEHIAESYRLAQDADVLMTLKKRTEDQKLADNKDGKDRGDLTLNVDKNRAGEDRKMIPLRFFRNHLTICEVDSPVDSLLRFGIQAGGGVVETAVQPGQEVAG
jgi:replicative DNA helicase